MIHFEQMYLLLALYCKHILDLQLPFNTLLIFIRFTVLLLNSYLKAQIFQCLLGINSCTSIQIRIVICCVPVLTQYFTVVYSAT